MLFPQFSDIIICTNSALNKGYAMYNYDDFIGKKYGKWTILKYAHQKKRMHFICKCECGTESMMQASAIFIGATKSCKFCAPKKHGFYKTPTNSAWSAARNRCFNKNNKDYADYGGRGINMCERWNKFENFLEDMGEKPHGLTLDRIDNNGNYEPSNCRWTSHSVQNSNQRKRFSFKREKE